MPERASFQNTEELQNHGAPLTFGEHLCSCSLHSVGEEAGMLQLSNRLQNKHKRSLTQPEQHLTEGHVWGEQVWPGQPGLLSNCQKHFLMAAADMK